MKPTKQNIDMLRTAEKYDKFLNKSRRGALVYLQENANCGGAVRRMKDRLIEQGLLNKDWPWRITDAGREALKQHGKQ